MDFDDFFHLHPPTEIKKSTSNSLENSMVFQWKKSFDSFFTQETDGFFNKTGFWCFFLTSSPRRRKNQPHSQWDVPQHQFSIAPLVRFPKTQGWLCVCCCGYSSSLVCMLLWFCFFELCVCVVVVLITGNVCCCSFSSSLLSVCCCGSPMWSEIPKEEQEEEEQQHTTSHTVVVVLLWVCVVVLLSLGRVVVIRCVVVVLMLWGACVLFLFCFLAVCVLILLFGVCVLLFFFFFSLFFSLGVRHLCPSLPPSLPSCGHFQLKNYWSFNKFWIVLLLRNLCFYNR